MKLHLHKYSDPLFSTLLKHLWQRLQHSLLVYGATSLSHLYLRSFSHSSLHIPSSSVRLDWVESLHSYFQVSPEMFDRVQVQALAGPLKDIQPLLYCLACVLRVVVLLED